MNPTSYDTIMDRFYTGPRVLEMVIEEASRETPPNQPNSSAFCVLQNVQENDIRKKNDTVIRFNDNNGSSSCPYVRTVELRQHLSTSPQPQHQSSNHLTSCSERSADEICDGVETGATIRVLLEDTGKQKIGAQREEKAASLQIHHSTHFTSNKNNEVHVTRTKRSVSSDALEQFIDNFLIISSASTRAEANENEKVETATPVREIRPRDVIDSKIEAVSAAVLTKAIETNGTSSAIGLDVVRQYALLNPFVSNQGSDMAQTISATAPVPSGQKALRERTSLSSCFGKATTLQKDPDDGRVESTTTTAIYPPYPQVHGAQFINTNPVNLDGLSKVQIAIYHLHQQGGGRVPPLSTVTSAAGSVKTGHDPLPSTMFPFPDIPRPKKTILGSLSTSVSVSAVGSSTTPNRLLADNSKDSPNITSLAPMEPQLLCVKVPNPLDIRRRPPGNDKSYKALISLYEQSFYQTRELALANRQYYMTGSVGSSGVIPSLTHCVIAIDKPRNQDHFTSSFSGNHGPGDEGRKMFNIISVRGGGSCNNAVTSKERLDNGTSQNVEDPKQQNHAESSCVSIGGDILAFMKNVPHVDKRNLYVMVDPYLPVNPFFDIDCSKWSFHHQPRQGEGTQLTVSLLEKLQHAVNTSLIIPLLQSEITIDKYTQECTELLGWLILECLTASLEAYFSTPLLPEDVPDGQPSQVLCNVSRVSLLTSSAVIPCKGTPFGGDKDVKLSLHAHFTLLLKRGFSDSFPVFFKNIAEHKIFTCEFLAINPAAKDILEFDPSQAAVNGSAPNGPNTRIVEVLRRIASSIIELQISAAEGKETKMGSATPQAHDVVRVLYNQALATTVDFILPGSEEQDNAAMSLDECKERLTIIYIRLLHELLCTVIDASIYTKWRPFRLPYNTKMVDFGQCFDSTVEREEFNNGDDSTNLIQVLENENNCEVVNQEAKAASAVSGGTNPGCVARSRYSISALTVLEQQFDEEVIKYHQKSRVMEGVPQQNNLIVFANSILDSGILCENHRNDKDECDLSCNNVHDKNADRSIVGRFLLPISPIYSFSTPHPEGGGRNLLCSFLLKYGNNCEQILGVDQQYFHQTVIEDALIHPYRYTGAVQHLMQCPDESKVQNSEFLHFYHSAFHHYTRSRLYKNIICCPLRNRYLRLINEVKSVIIAVPVDDSEIERIRQAMASLRRECTALLSDIEPSILKKQHEIVKRTMDDIDSLLGAEKTGSKRPRIEESIDGEVSVALVTPLQQLISLMTKDRSGKGDGEKEELKRLDNILNFDFSGNSDPMKKKTNGIPERRTGEMSYFLCPFVVPPIVSMVVLQECFTDKTDLSVSPADMQTQMSTRWQEFLVRVLEIFFDSTVTSIASSGDGAAQMVTGPYIPRTPFGSGRRVVINDLCIRELLAEVFRCLHPQFGHAGSKVISAKTLTKCEYEDNGTSRGYYVCQKTNNFCMKLHRFHKSTFGQLYLTYGSIKYRCYSNDCCYRCLCIPWCGNNMGNNELEEGNGGSSYYPDHRQLLYLRDLLFPNLFPETPEK